MIPFAVVVAFAVTLIDPQQIRASIDHMLGRGEPNARSAALIPPPPPVAPTLPEGGASETPLIPLPPAAPTPAPPAPDAATPAATPPSPEAEAAPVHPAPGSPAPATPASTNPAPGNPVPGQAAAPTPATDAAAAPAPIRAVIYYRRGQASAQAQAQRVAAKVGNAELKPSIQTPRSPVIYYFALADRSAATAIARSLAGEGAPSWIVRAGTLRAVGGTVDIMLP